MTQRYNIKEIWLMDGTVIRPRGSKPMQLYTDGELYIVNDLNIADGSGINRADHLLLAKDIKKIVV